MNDDNAVSIQVLKNDSAFKNQITNNESISHIKLETSSFDGQSEVLTFLISLTPLAMVCLTKILVEQIRSKRYVKLIYKGLQIQGLNEKNIESTLKKIISKKIK